MQKILELSTTLLAATLGLWFYKGLNGFHRFIFWQVIVYLVIDSVAIIVEDPKKDNGWVYTLQIPVETALLFFAAQSYFGGRRSRNVLIALFGLVMSILFIDWFCFVNITGLAHHALILQYIITAGVFVALLYSVFMHTNNKRLNAPYILTAVGSVLYFLGTVPYLCLMFYFHGQDPEANNELFMLIILSLGLLRYLLTAIAFVLAGQRVIRGKEEFVEQINNDQV